MKDKTSEITYLLHRITSYMIRIMRPEHDFERKHLVGELETFHNDIWMLLEKPDMSPKKKLKGRR